MSTYLYAFPAPLVFTEENRKPGDLVPDRVHDGNYYYLSGSPLDYPGGTLVGAWNAGGTVMLDDNSDPIPIDPLFYEIRPFGNAADDLATDTLNYHFWMGHAQRHMQADPALDSNPLYPADNQPFTLKMERVENQYQDKWGWTATIEFPDPNRVPTSRAIGIYDEDWTFLYQTGGFIWTDTGDGVFKWQTVCEPGQTLVDAEPIYYAMLFGSALEGKTVLPLTSDEQTRNFWEAGQVIPGEEWVDSGETVTGMAGTVTLVSDVAPFPVGTQVRIEGAEMAVTSIWAGQGLVLDPYRSSTTGAAIEIWQ